MDARYHQQQHLTAPPPWPFTDGPTPRLHDARLVAEINKTEEDVEQRLLQLKRTVHGTSFYLSTAAVQQKERLKKYREMLVDYRQRLGLRAGWIRSTLATLRQQQPEQPQQVDMDTSSGDTGHVFCLPLISEDDM